MQFDTFILVVAGIVLLGDAFLFIIGDGKR